MKPVSTLVTLLLAGWAFHDHANAGDSSPPLRRISFGSCAQQEKPQPIWEAVVASKPELFLFLGDNIYGDTKDMEVMKAKYAKLAAFPGYQKLLKTCPLLATWDDHDFGVNDGGAEYPMKKESQQVFLEFFKEPKDSPRWKQEGVYLAKVFGPPDKSVQIILLDTRYHRSPLKKKPGKPVQGEGPYIPNADPMLTVLGETQWHWLAEQFKVPARIRLVCSSIQVVPEDHGWEKWANHPLQRERLFNLIRDTKAAGVIFLSGDRHLAELSMMDAGVGYPLYDLTSSGLNQAFVKWRKQESNRHRVATMNFGHNFGAIAIDWEQPDPVISLQIRDEVGDITIQQKLPLNVLQPGFLKTKSGSHARLADGTVLTMDVIKKHVGQKVTIEMEVKATGTSATSGLIFLNSEENRLSPDNFTVVLDKKAQEKLKAHGIAMPRSHYADKTIRVTGTLSLFRDQPQIIVSDAAQIEVVKN